MELALEALRSQTMNLTKASSSFGIPSTTLWQRAHRLGINTPKKDTQVRMRKITKFTALFKRVKIGLIQNYYFFPNSKLEDIVLKKNNNIYFI